MNAGGTKLYRVANTKDPKQRLKVIFDEDDPDQLPSKQVRASHVCRSCPCPAIPHSTLPSERN